MKPFIAADFETDPFKHGRIPKPFVAGAATSQLEFRHFWGDDCVFRFIHWLTCIEEPHDVYFHNGGKFDFFMMLNYFDGAAMIVNGRIVKIRMAHHEFRDSFAAMPEPLAKFGAKTTVPTNEVERSAFYAKMERENREKNKDEIIDYLKEDCVVLYRALERFRHEFGDELTAGGAALKQLKKFHPEIQWGDERLDKDVRPYYFGGRVECFATGIHHGSFKIYDVNSMYPAVMRNVRHPLTPARDIRQGREAVINDKTVFATVRAINRGALPYRAENGSLTFNQPDGVFKATIHEIEAGEETGTLDIIEVLETVDFFERGTFADFIDHFYSERLAAKASGDGLWTIYTKRIMNSSYGKTAMDPDKFLDWYVTDFDVAMPGIWTKSVVLEDIKKHFWSKPSLTGRYYNVAIGASITGAARAKMLMGIQASETPLYCDTDSIVCKTFHGEVDPDTLGAWKLEQSGDEIAIAGKKIYALFQQGKCVKNACKGAVLTGDEIRIAASSDNAVVWRSEAPTFKIDGRHQFVTRRIKRTTL